MQKISLDPIEKLFRDAWNLYVERFAVTAQIFAGAVILLGFGNIFQAAGYPFSIAGMILSVAGLLLFLVSTAACIHALHHKENFEASYRAGGSLFLPLVWAAILMFLAWVGGATLLIIPGLFLGIGMVFTNYVLVIEGRRGISALAASRGYVRGYWWAVFGRVILLGLIAAFLLFLVGVPFALVGGAIGQAIASALVLFFLAPFSAAYYYAVYKNLRELKPHHAGAPVAEGKTFLVVAQIVGIVAIIVLSVVITVSAIFKEPPGPPMPGAASFPQNGQWQ